MRTNCAVMPMLMCRIRHTTWHQEASTGRVMSILNDDINQLERFLDGGANDIIQVSTTVITVSAVFLDFRCCRVGVTADSIDSVGLIPVPKNHCTSLRGRSRRCLTGKRSTVQQSVGDCND